MRMAVFAVGLHIDPAAVTYVLVDLSGAVRDHSRTGTPTAGDPSAVIEEMASAIEALIAGSGVDRSRILGIGIASPGPVNVADGVLLNPPMMPSWRRVALRHSLAKATGLPVLLEKDTTATVVAELWFAGPGSRRDFAFMYYGTGLGTGLSLSGRSCAVSAPTRATRATSRSIRLVRCVPAAGAAASAT